MHPLRRLVALVAVAALVGGCVPSQPSPNDWRRQARQSLEDVLSEVATAQVVLREQAAGHLLTKAGVVMLVDAEESAGTTAETFSALQPPEGFEQRHAKVSDALERASGLIADARMARVREDQETYVELQRSLVHERSMLAGLREQLR
jgi:hypothetical protein